MMTVDRAITLMNTNAEYIHRLMAANLCDDCKLAPQRMCERCDPKVFALIHLAHSLPLDGVYLNGN